MRQILQSIKKVEWLKSSRTEHVKDTFVGQLHRVLPIASSQHKSSGRLVNQPCIHLLKRPFHQQPLHEYWWAGAASTNPHSQSFTLHYICNSNFSFISIDKTSFYLLNQYICHLLFSANPSIFVSTSLNSEYSKPEQESSIIHQWKPR